MNKEFLLLVIDLLSSIRNNDEKKCIESCNKINEIELDNIEKNYIVENLREFRPFNDKVLTSVSNLNFIENKNTIIILLKLDNGYKFNKEELKEIINENLVSEYHIKLSSIYSLIIPMVIGLNDSELLKELIDKIQAL